MAKKKRMRIQFPLGGLDRKASYRQQPPYTTPDCSNVRPVGVLASRERGGSRPGVIEAYPLNDLGSNVRLLYPMVVAPGDDFTAWSDVFNGTSMASCWTQASWATDTFSILQQMASVDTSVSDAAVVRDALTIDTTKGYSVEMFIVPWDAAFHGKYQIYLRMDNTTPVYTTEGVEVELTMTGTGGAWSGTIKSYSGSVLTTVDSDSGTINPSRPGWLIVGVSGNTITVYWNGVTILSGTADAHTGTRVGFGMECSVSGGVCLCNVFRVQYYSTGTVPSLRSILVGSADGDIYKEGPYARVTKVTTNLSVRSDVSLTATQSGQKLYIADHGDLRASGSDGVVSGATLDSATYADWSTLSISKYDDVVVLSNVTGDTTAGVYAIDSVAAGAITLTGAPGDGNCSFRIERGVKIYDPIANTLTMLTATAGQVPQGNPLICRHMDRLFLAGADIAPHVWYAARQGTETDWDYSQTDNQRAVAGTASELGVPGEAITALAPHSDDYLIIGCRNSLWRLRGDPAFDGTLDALSHAVGIVGAHAWCVGPAGELIFLSLDGIYILPPGGDSVPISMSGEVLPQELLNFDPDTTIVLLEYDVQNRGVHIYLTPESSNAKQHWWMDWDRKTFWPMVLSTNYEPTATCSLQATAIEDSGVILGCRDGVLRRFSEFAETDCGTAFTTYIDVGPLPLAPDGQVGILTSIDGEIAANSGNVTWGVYPASTFEGTATADVQGTGTWVAGLNATVYPGGRGQACLLRLTGASGRKWAFEQLVATVTEAGPRRVA